MTLSPWQVLIHNDHSNHHKPFVRYVVIFICLFLFFLGAQRWTMDTSQFTGLQSTIASKQEYECPQHPCHLSIVFMGDSLTRFMYYSLAYFLRHGRWIDPDSNPHLVRPRDFFNTTNEGATVWIPWYRASSQALEPMELCDCWREPGNIIKEGDPSFNSVCENRYYHDPIRNNTLVFFQSYGEVIPIRGHYGDPVQATFDRGSLGGVYENPLQDNFPFNWSLSWIDVIQQQVTPLRASYLVINAGLWNHGFYNDAFVDDFLLAIQVLESESTTRTIWKTTTPYYDGDYGNLFIDLKMCQKLDGCLNITPWLLEISTDYYVDSCHYVEPIYRAMNEQLLLSTLGGVRMPKDYQALNVSHDLIQRKSDS